MTGMDLTIHASFLPHADPEASLAFYRDTLGFEVRPFITDDERRTITEMMAEEIPASRSSLGPAIPPDRCESRL